MKAMYYAIAIYLVLNAFLAGIIHERESTWADAPFDKAKLFAGSLLNVVVLIPMVLLSFLWDGFKWLDDRTFSVLFWLGFWFTKKYHNLDIRVLEHINKVNEKWKHKKNLKGWIFRKGTEAVNKRNNYTPPIN